MCARVMRDPWPVNLATHNSREAWSAEHSELLIELEARNAKSLEAQSAES